MRSASPGALAAVLLLALGLCSCAARVEAVFTGSGPLELSARTSVPPASAAKLRAAAGLPSTAPLFDAQAARRSLEARRGVTVISASLPTPDSLLLLLSIPDPFLTLASSQPGLPLSLSVTAGLRELRLRLAKENGAAALALVPGLDPELVAALEAPALEGGDFTVAEYREVLAGMLGRRVLGELVATRVELSVTVPGTPVHQQGGSLEGNTWRASLPLLDLLVLERPIELSLSWRN